MDKPVSYVCAVHLGILTTIRMYQTADAAEDIASYGGGYCGGHSDLRITSTMGRWVSWTLSHSREFQLHPLPPQVYNLAPDHESATEA